MPSNKNKKHTIYFVLDEFSIEIFIDGLSLTSLIYPDQDDDMLDISVNADRYTLTKYK